MNAACDSNGSQRCVFGSVCEELSLDAAFHVSSVQMSFGWELQVLGRFCAGNEELFAVRVCHAMFNFFLSGH